MIQRCSRRGSPTAGCVGVIRFSLKQRVAQRPSISVVPRSFDNHCCCCGIRTFLWYGRGESFTYKKDKQASETDGHVDHSVAKGLSFE